MNIIMSGCNQIELPTPLKFNEGRSTFLASLPQWAGHSQRLGYGQVRLPNGEKGHQFESNSIKPKRDTHKRIGQCLQSYICSKIMQSLKS